MSDEMRTVFITDPIYLEHRNPSFHPESTGRLDSIMDAFDLWSRKDSVIVEKPVRATREQITAVHEPVYYDKTASAKDEYLDPDTFISDKSFEAASFAAGALIKAVDLVDEGTAKRVFCAVRPPGHHAEKNTAMGFCLFNNVAVAARYAQTKGYSKVMIIDFDVHHGNGTQHIFQDDPTVFFFSSHQYPFYPGTGSASQVGVGEGRGFTKNFPMDAGSGDTEYEVVYRDSLPGILGDFDPSIVLVSAGYDIHKADPLGGMSVTTEGVRNIVQAILNASGERPVIFTLEGGYDYQALADSVIATLEELAGV